jgi:hypothetical protein
MSRLYQIGLIVLSTGFLWFMGLFKLLALLTLSAILYLVFLVEELQLRVDELERKNQNLK